MQQVPADYCLTYPDQYQLCSKDLCISREYSCPCLEKEYQCFLGDCISEEDLCNGSPDCMYADDESEFKCSPDGVVDYDMAFIGHTSGGEVSAATRDGLSLPVIVTISSVCVFVTVLMVIFIGIFIAKRHKNNTSRESQSASEPLRKSYITTYTGSETDTPQQKRRPIPLAGSVSSRDTGSYLPVGRADHVIDEGGGDVIEIIEPENPSSVRDTEADNENVKQNLAIRSGVEIYDVNAHDSSRVHGLGKYTFKPRLKYLNTKPYNELDEKDRDKLYVINSYRHCSGKSIIPSTLTFDKDPQQFSDMFAEDLLCSSTPRPPLRGLVKVGQQCINISHESIPSTVQNETVKLDI